MFIKFTWALDYDKSFPLCIDYLPLMKLGSPPWPPIMHMEKKSKVLKEEL